MEYWKLLKKMRKDRGLTLEQLSSMSGIPTSTLSDYENNKVDPPVSKYIKILNCLRVNPLIFLSVQEEYLKITHYSEISRKKVFAIDALESKNLK